MAQLKISYKVYDQDKMETKMRIRYDELGWD